jgi:hypothetical protein
MIKTIKFKNIDYPIKSITFPFGERIIGTESLNKVLINKNNGYISEKARIIDEHIFYFVTEEELFDEKNLALKIISEL